MSWKYDERTDSFRRVEKLKYYFCPICKRYDWLCPACQKRVKDDIRCEALVLTHLEEHIRQAHPEYSYLVAPDIDLANVQPQGGIQ